MKKRKIEEDKQANMKRILEGMLSENEKRRRVLQETEAKRKSAAEVSGNEKRRRITKEAEAKSQTPWSHFSGFRARGEWTSRWGVAYYVIDQRDGAKSAVTSM